MSSGAIRKSWTAEEYLAMEERADGRHEFLRGEIVAMPGGTLAHNEVALNLVLILRAEFRRNGGNCRAYVNDVRVNPAAGAYFYPDVFAVCGEPQMLPNRNDTVCNPILIAEVLSRTTEANDRGVKLAEYLKDSTLREYVLLRQDRIQIEIYRRHDPRWTYELVQDPEALISLESVGVEFRLKDLYEGVRFETAEAGPRLLTDPATDE